jgi:hypothetical protein
VVSDGVASPAMKNFLARYLLEGNPVPFDGKIRAFNMPGLSYTRGGKPRTYPGHWVMDLEGDSGSVHVDQRDLLLFDYDPEATKTRHWPSSEPSTNPVALVHSKGLAGLSNVPKRQYAVSYTDLHVGMGLLMPLYRPFAPHQGAPLRLTFDDIKKSVFFGTRDGKAFVVRPRVSTDAAYLAYLRDTGATA